MTRPVERFANPGEAGIAALLRNVRTIAVVGLSPRPGRPSYRAARALQEFGYRIIPVRPGVEAVLGEKAYARLEDIPVPVDLVDVFRAPEYVEAIVDSCLAIRASPPLADGVPVCATHTHPWALWLQDGVVNDAAAIRARSAGMEVVVDRCVCRDYRRLLAATP